MVHRLRERERESLWRKEEKKERRDSQATLPSLVRAEKFLFPLTRDSGELTGAAESASLTGTLSPSVAVSPDSAGGGGGGEIGRGRRDVKKTVGSLNESEQRSGGQL